MHGDIEKRAGRFSFFAVIGVLLVLLIGIVFGDYFYTINPAVRSLANGVPVCDKAHQVYGGEPGQMSQLNLDEQEEFFSAVAKSDSSFYFLKHKETSTVLFYQRKGGAAPLFVVLLPLDPEATPREVKFCGLFEVTPWDFSTQHLAKKAGESWRMRTMVPEQTPRGK